jgi:hypothetical protein
LTPADYVFAVVVSAASAALIIQLILEVQEFPGLVLAFFATAGAIFVFVLMALTA